MGIDSKIKSPVAILSLFAIFIAIFGLLGYIPALHILSPIPMAPSTAISFIVLASIFLTIICRPISAYLFSVFVALIIIITLYAGLSVVGYFTGMDFNVEAFILGPAENLEDNIMGRMSVITGFLFLVASLAIFIQLWRVRANNREARFGDFIGLLGAGICTTAIIVFFAHIFESQFLYGEGATIPIALTTSLAFIALGAALCGASGKSSIPLRWLSSIINNGTKMGDSKRLFTLGLVMALVSLTVMTITIIMLYRSDFTTQKKSLMVAVQSQARLIEAIARHNALDNKLLPNGSLQVTMDQILDAHNDYKGFGETGEFVLAQLNGNVIEFIVRDRYNSKHDPQSVSLDSTFAEPMQLALEGIAGTVIGLDYRGETVLAAFEPIPILNMGLVAKINLTELRKPFIKTGLTASVFAFVFILVGSVAFFWLGRPIIIQLRRHSLNLEKEVGERKQIEEHLRISKERLSGFMESATDGFVLLDSTLNHIMMNHAAYTITGLETESVLGKNILETIPGIHESGRYDAYKEVIKTGKPIHIIDITSYPMTGVKHIELKAFKVGDGLGIILTDISNRMQAEQHEKTRNKMLELLAGDAPLPIILNSIVRGMEILHPDTLCSILLLDKEGKHLEKGVAPSLPNFYNAAIDGIEIGIGVGSCGTAAFTGKRVIVEDIATHPYWAPYKELAARARLGSCWSQPIQSSSGKVLGTFAIYHHDAHMASESDLSIIEEFSQLASLAIERKQAEDALRESESYNRMLFAQSPIGLALTKLDGTLVDTNQAYADIIGRTTDETLTMNYWEITPEKYNDEEKQIQIALNDVGEYGPYEKEYIHKDGHLVPVRLQGLQIMRNGEKYIWSSVEDITEHRRIEEQLQIHQRMDSLGTLVGGIAHDFNNILSALMGNIELLNKHDENFNEKQKRFLKNATKSTHRAVELTKQFQTLSTVTSNNNEVVDIHDIAQEVFSLLAQTTDRLISKELKFNKGEFLVSANSGELHQVLLNLATNSKHSIEEREITNSDYIQMTAEHYQVIAEDIMGLKEGDYVHISFKDTGSGMSDEVLKRAFEPMFTTKDKDSNRGQGLGLAMVYNIVTKHNHGFIEIKSKQGQGTTFHIYLPKAQAAITVESQKHLPQQRGTETILVVDDDEMVANLAEDMLIDVGYKVLIASDGIEALKIYSQKMDVISAVILDLNMPNMSGKQVFQEMLKINPEVRVIISSGYGAEHLQQDVLGKAKGNLSKPYTLDGLYDVVRNVIDD